MLKRDIRPGLILHIRNSLRRSLILLRRLLHKLPHRRRHIRRHLRRQRFALRSSARPSETAPSPSLASTTSRLSLFAGSATCESRSSFDLRHRSPTSSSAILPLMHLSNTRAPGRPYVSNASTCSSASRKSSGVFKFANQRCFAFCCASVTISHASTSPSPVPSRVVETDDSSPQ